MEPGNHSSSLIEKLLRSERSDNWNSAEINRLCDIIRQTSFLANRLIVEIKACRGLIDDHVAQLLGYLRASRLEHGPLINFGGPKLQIKKYILTRDN